MNDCYFLGALAAVALCAIRKAALFHSTDYGDMGLYVVTFYKRGEPIHVVIDDRLPVGIDGRLLFAECTDGSIWAPLIEKAYAKLHRGYYEQF